MSDYSGLTVQQALDLFYEKYDLGDEGGIDKNWAYLKLGPVYIPFPNTAERKRALLFHDIHHIATGYESDWRGELTENAWEVASGCADFRAAWFLDLGGLFLGLLMYPKDVYRSFVRGRRSTNLYHMPDRYTRQQLLDMKVEEVQSLLSLDSADSAKGTGKESIAFTLWSLLVLLLFGGLSVAPFLLLCFLLKV